MGITRVGGALGALPGSEGHWGSSQGKRGHWGHYQGKRGTQAVLWSRSWPEPDFLAGAGAGENAPDPGCCCLA